LRFEDKFCPANSRAYRLHLILAAIVSAIATLCCCFLGMRLWLTGDDWYGLGCIFLSGVELRYFRRLLRLL
jgi:hypothetical protein